MSRRLNSLRYDSQNNEPTKQNLNKAALGIAAHAPHLTIYTLGRGGATLTTHNESHTRFITENSDEFNALVDAISDLRKAIAAYHNDFKKRKVELLVEIVRLRDLNAGP